MDSLQAKKQLANNAFMSGDFETAKRMYAECLEVKPNDEIFLSNKAATHLKLEEFEEALQDARKVLESNPTHTKAIFRTGKALIGLKRFEEALEILSTSTNLTTNEQQSIDKLVERAKVYVEQQRGNYDFIYFLRTEEDPLFHDIADYFGPLKILPITGKGRGIVATKDIEPGDLLIVSKAFAVSFSSSEPSRLVRLQKTIMDKLVQRPSKGKILYRLYAGPDMGYLDPEKDDCSVVDFKRIFEIINFNSFACSGSGIWIEPSFINNDCLDFNAIYCAYGDVMTVRAVRSIKAGDEVTVCYTKSRYSYLHRKKILLDSFGFKCQCSLCLSQMVEPASVLEERGALLEYFRDRASMHTLNLKVEDVQKKIVRLEQLSKDSDPVHRVHYMFNAYFVLALVYVEEKLFAKSTDLLKELALNLELNLRDKYGPYAVGGHYRGALYQLLLNLYFTGDEETAKDVFPVILENFEVVEGKVGVEGYKVVKPSDLWPYLDKISKK